jgi:hypothetical protein
MGHASYGNNSEQEPKVGEKPDPNAAARKPEGGQDRPGADLGGAKDRGGQAAQDLPAAGPHSDPDLTNKNATPGAGTLPEPGNDPDSTDATSG